MATHRSTDAEDLPIRDSSLNTVAELLSRSIATVEAIAVQFGAQAAQRRRPDLLCPAHRRALARQSTVDTGEATGVLTARQMDVLRLLAAGHSNRGIARRLGISEKTVKNHMQAIFVRLGVADRTQAALAAVRHKLVRLAATPTYRR